MKLRALPSVAVVVSLGLAAAAPAQAAESETHLQVISASSTYFIDDEVTGEDAITLTGTSNLAAGAKVDLNCYSGTTWTRLAENVVVGTGGSFSFGGFLHPIADATCVLRAVPVALASNDYPPNSPSRFWGPLLAIGQRYDHTIASGPNAGRLLSQYLYASQLGGAFDYGTLGDCSIIDSYTYDPINFGSSPLNRLDACDAFLWWENGRKASGFASPTRSDLQVDGNDAFLPGNIASIFSGAESLAGFPTLSEKYSLDPATGNLTIEEGEPVVRCSPGGAFPPSAGTCSAFVPTGIQAFLRITQSASGHVASVSQYFESVDGRSHQIDVLDDNEFFTPREDGEFDLPWLTSGFQEFTTPGQVLAGAPSSPTTLYAKVSASEGVEGAVTLSNAPEQETIVGTTNNSSETSRINLHYHRTVPAGQYVALGFTYSNGFAPGEVEAEAATAQAAYQPRVAITTPGPVTTPQSSITLTGTAGGSAPLASLVVGGQSVPVSPSGTWSATVALAPGQNTVTASATNIYGNAAEAQLSVTYVHPPGPTPFKLVGKPGLAASGVAFTVRCQAAAGERCHGLGRLTTEEHLRSGRLVGLTASSKGGRPRQRTSTIEVGSHAFSVASGARVRVVVPLNQRGRRMLSRFGALPVSLLVQHEGPAGAGGVYSVSSSHLRLHALHTRNIARSIQRLIRSARHLRAEVSCPTVVVRVRGGQFVCTATGTSGKGSHRTRFRTPFTVTETDTKGDVRFRS